MSDDAFWALVNVAVAVACLLGNGASVRWVLRRNRQLRRRPGVPDGR